MSPRSSYGGSDASQHSRRSRGRTSEHKSSRDSNQTESNNPRSRHDSGSSSASTSASRPIAQQSHKEKTQPSSLAAGSDNQATTQSSGNCRPSGSPAGTSSHRSETPESPRLRRKRASLNLSADANVATRPATSPGADRPQRRSQETNGVSGSQRRSLPARAMVFYASAPTPPPPDSGRHCSHDTKQGPRLGT